MAKQFGYPAQRGGSDLEVSDRAKFFSSRGDFEVQLKVGTFIMVPVSKKIGIIGAPRRAVADRLISEETRRMMSAAVADQICREDSAIAHDTSIDAQLAERIRSGDRSAFEQLVVTYQSSVFGLIYRLIGDAEEARDVTQETFLKVYQKIDQFRGESNLKTWIYRIATRQASNHRRWWFRRGRHQTVSLDGPRDDDDRLMIDTLADEHPDSEQALIAREREAQLARALRRIKPSYREAVILRDVDGCSYEEIAAVLRISIGTVKSRIARGREMLRKELVRNHPGSVDD